MEELLEMAIRHMEHTRAECRTTHIIASCDAAIEALREKLEREKNEPLTLEELREMIGKPVWVCGPGAEEFGRWIIVLGVSLEEKSLYCLDDFNCHDYGRVWLAYRYEKDAAVD